MNQCLSPQQFVMFLDNADLWGIVEVVNSLHIKINATAGEADWFFIGKAVCLGGFLT